MGYCVRIVDLKRINRKLPPQYLWWGKPVEKSNAAYYSSPSAAKLAAKNYLKTKCYGVLGAFIERCL